MTTYIIEYSDGSEAANEHGAYPEFFRHVDRKVDRARIRIERLSRMGTLSTPYRFLEVVEGSALDVRRYADVVHYVFGGPMRVRRGYPIAEFEQQRKRRSLRGDLVHNAGMDSFPASDAPGWSYGATGDPSA